MSLNSKGKNILRKSGYRRVRDQLLKDVTESINIEGSYGDKIIDHIDRVIDKDVYTEIKNELSELIKENLGIEDQEEVSKFLKVLLQEDISPELSENLYTHEHGRKDIISDEDYRTGKQEKLWEHVSTVVLGKETSPFDDLMILLKEHSIIRWTLVIGFFLLGISSFLLRSVYKSVIAGLTLTAEPGESLRIMLGNITGALGGILLFFVFISLLIQDKYLASNRDEKLRKLADKTLKEKFEK